jgi:hypothetical protein
MLSIGRTVGKSFIARIEKYIRFQNSIVNRRKVKYRKKEIFCRREDKIKKKRKI